MSPYWNNNSCSPFLDPEMPCTLGNLASYAIDIRCAEDAITGIRFAEDNNIRLSIKNTGHDFLGRSSGGGSLALWMHNLKQVEFFDYASPLYTGPAVRVGAGVEYSEVYMAASARGYRVVGGSCPTVGLAGGFSQGGGHGPLGAAYGLAADQVLEWEVVTASGEHLALAGHGEHADLFWALSGGGGGNFAVVLSMTVRAHADGPVAGAGFSFTNPGNDTVFWGGITAWLRHLLVLHAFHRGITTVFAITAKSFALEFATLPDTNTTDTINAAMAPFVTQLSDLNISLAGSYQNNVHKNFAEHYSHWATQSYASNITLGGRLIPRSVVQDEMSGLPALVNNFRDIAHRGAVILSVAANVTNVNHIHNAVLPSWRDSLFTTTFARSLPQESTWDTILADYRQLNAWQEDLRAITPGAGTYMNEATWDNPHWKEDYFGSNYNELLAVKTKYDPRHVFWANAAVGSDEYWKATEDRRLCRI